jgi:hypothetical protein
LVQETRSVWQAGGPGPNVSNSRRRHPEGTPAVLEPLARDGAERRGGGLISRHRHGAGSPGGIPSGPRDDQTDRPLVVATRA